MEQVHQILINRFFTGFTTVVEESNLRYNNNYYYNQSGVSDDIVDYSNVRSFLLNENNKNLVSPYYDFLTASPLMNSAVLYDQNTTLFVPTAAFKEIYYDDEKLADSYNNFYNSSLSRGISSNYLQNPDIFNTSVKNQLSSNGDENYVTQEVFHNYYFWEKQNPISPAYSPPKKPFFTASTADAPYYTTPVLDIYGGDRDDSTEERFVEVPVDTENYYINVMLLKKHTFTNRMAFEVCKSVIYKGINSNGIFSQNLVDNFIYKSYINHINITSAQSIDSAPLQTQEELISTMEHFSAPSPLFPLSNVINQGNTEVTLIQCFVDPNFKTNENEYWND